eukprot:160335-Hanusia_phi.AAC.3
MQHGTACLSFCPLNGAAQIVDALHMFVETLWCVEKERQEQLERDQSRLGLDAQLGSAVEVGRRALVKCVSHRLAGQAEWRAGAGPHEAAARARLLQEGAAGGDGVGDVGRPPAQGGSNPRAAGRRGEVEARAGDAAARARVQPR